MQIVNRKARFNFEIEEEIEAGMILLGSEVKSLREGKASISEAYIAEIQGEMVLVNANINEYKGANKFNHEPKRNRKLLLHTKEIDKLMGKMNIKGYSATPLKIYFNKRNVAKVLIGIGKGKKLFDKRQSIKERDDNRRQQRGED
jgi:SsrA-binding protein